MFSSLQPATTHFQDYELVCHCFGHTKKDIERDIDQFGHSSIMEQIQQAKKIKGCQRRAAGKKIDEEKSYRLSMPLKRLNNEKRFCHR